MFRAQRISIQPLREVEFRLTQPNIIFKVANITSLGVGLIAADKQALSVLQTYKGVFFFEAKRYPTTLKIIHITDKIVGAKFVDDLSYAQQFFKRYLEFELSQIQFQKINPEFLEKPDEGEAVWFRDARGSEFYFIHSQALLIYFYVSFLGNYIEWELNKSLRFGHIVKDIETSQKVRPTELIRWASIPKDFYEIIKTLTDQLRDLNETDRKNILEVIATYENKTVTRS